MVDESSNTPAASVSPPPRPWWLRPVRFVFQIVRILIAVATAIGTRAAINEGGPLAGLVILAGIALLLLVTWLLWKGLNLLAADSVRPTPSRGLAIFKLILGVPLAYLSLFGLNPEWTFGLLPAGGKDPQPLMALAYAVPLAIGIHLILMAAFALASSRPPIWLRATIALVVLGGGVGLGPKMSQEYLAYERSVGKYPAYISGFGDSVYLAFTPTNDGVYTLANDGRLEYWNFAKGQERAPIKGYAFGTTFYPAGISADRRLLAWRLGSGSYGVCDLTTTKDVVNQSEAADALAISDDGKLIARAYTGVVDPLKIELRKVPEGEVLRTVEGDKNQKVTSIVFSPDGKQLHAAIGEGENSKLLVWSTDGGSPRELATLPTKVWRFAISPDGKLLAATGSANGIAIVDIDSGKTIVNFIGHGDHGIDTLAFSGDSRFVVSAGNVLEGEAIVWDARTGQIYYQRSIPGVYAAAALSTDNKLLAVSANYRVKVWDVSGLLPPGK